MSADLDLGSSDLQQLDVDAIVPNAGNPRLNFPEEELDRLAESIDQEGILVPINVFPRGDKFVLIDGERRYRCAVRLGHATVPALVSSEKSDFDILQQMFNIHLIREPWQDMPTAVALQKLAGEIEVREGRQPRDIDLRTRTGLSMERIRRLRYVMTLPEDWQQYIAEARIPLNFFWELKRSVIDPLASMRPKLLEELNSDNVMASFVEKRLNDVITDTVSLRKVAQIVRFSRDAESEGGAASKSLDRAIRDLVHDVDTTIEDVYEDTVQIMVEVDKLERRSASMVTAFSRLLATSTGHDDRARIKEICKGLVGQLEDLVRDASEPNE